MGCDSVYEEGNLNKKLLIVGIILGVILIGVIIYLIITREKPITKELNTKYMQVTEKYSVDISHIKKDIDKLDFISSDESVATIDKNGIVVAKGEGTTTIQIKDNKYNYVTQDITVEQTKNKIILEYLKKELALNVNEAYNIKYNIKDFAKITEEFKFTSSNPKVATIDTYGNVRAIKEGKVIITTTLKGKHFKIACNLKVLSPVKDETEQSKEDEEDYGIIDES